MLAYRGFSRLPLALGLADALAEELDLRVFARLPSAEERKETVAFLASAEFRFNH